MNTDWIITHLRTFIKLTQLLITITHAVDQNGGLECHSYRVNGWKTNK